MNDNIFTKYIRIGGDEPMNYEQNLLSRRWEHIKAILNDELVPPYEVEIQSFSNCNLSCAWCIGSSIQTMNQVTRLPNIINADNILRIINGIAEYRKNNFRIDKVKFSGFIGEPLLNKEATLAGIKCLVSRGIEVGLFTNGILLSDPEIQEALLDIDYVHISLDAGTAETFALTKSKNNYKAGKEWFELILNNLYLLSEMRKRQSRPLKVNVGFIANPYNYKEALSIAKEVKNRGADFIRFKCDVAGKMPLSLEQISLVSKQISQAKADLEDRNFRVIQAHTDDEMKVSAHRSFSKCYSHLLSSTVGSDGNLYPCDFTTFPGAPYYGNVINRSFKDVWEGPLRKRISKGLTSICHRVCAPFALRINPFLEEIKKVNDEKGIEFVENQRMEFLAQRKAA